MARDARITMRFTEEERRLLEKAAELSKIMLGSYIRMVLLQDAEKRVRFYEKIKS